MTCLQNVLFALKHNSVSDVFIFGVWKGYQVTDLRNLLVKFDGLLNVNATVCNLTVIFSGFVQCS